MDAMTSTSTSLMKNRIVNAGKVAAVVAATGALIAACGDDGDNSSSSTKTAAASGDSAVAEAATVESSAAASGTAPSAYTDGEYSAFGSYQSPGGRQEVGVTVTLSNSVITALTLDTSQTKGTSAEFQGKFASGIDALVVGKSIDELDVSKVSGSSLTSGGFNDAIEQIKTEAQS